LVLMLRSPKSSSACAREPSSSCCRNRARRSSSVSFSSESKSPSSSRRSRFASLRSSTRCVFDFLLALASASAFAFASAAFFAFSRSTSESSAASHDSSTCRCSQYTALVCFTWKHMGAGCGLTHIAIVLLVVELAAARDGLAGRRGGRRAILFLVFCAVSACMRRSSAACDKFVARTCVTTYPTFLVP
jgi:hypothetical protein